MGKTHFCILRNEPAVQPAKIITCSGIHHVGHRDQQGATMIFLKLQTFPGHATVARPWFRSVRLQ